VLEAFTRLHTVRIVPVKPALRAHFAIGVVLDRLRPEGSVPEGSNLEIAHALSAKSEAETASSKARWEELVEIIEALLLAFVVIATAWSGYQAARWDGVQGERYGTSAAMRFKADELITLGGQQRLLDVSTFNTWIQATTDGKQELADLYVRRFSPEYAVAFEAWLATDPLNNPDAPPGPSYMPEYTNSQIDQGTAMNQEANKVFEEGTAARAQAEEYVQTTLIFATVLFLLALSPRFKLRNVRIGVAVVAAALMILGVVTIAVFPRL
jgi:hypothetical protein